MSRERRVVVVLERRHVMEYEGEIVPGEEHMLMTGDAITFPSIGKVRLPQGREYPFVGIKITVKEIYLEPPIWIQNLKRWLHL